RRDRVALHLHQHLARHRRDEPCHRRLFQRRHHQWQDGDQVNRPIRALTALALAAGALTGTVVTQPPAFALANGLALTPPMGFNDWNAVGCGTSETFIKQTADFFHSHKLSNGNALQQLGYQYVNIDDCWALPSRDSHGNLVPDPKKFPDGISGTAAYVHSLGLKLGLYNDSGLKTCSSHGFPGSFQHEAQDALQFAKWGGDY